MSSFWQNRDDSVTPPELYWRRRDVIRAMGGIASVAATGALYRYLRPSQVIENGAAEITNVQTDSLDIAERVRRGWLVSDELTTEATILNYNNFYEFTTDKERVAHLTRGFNTDGWLLAVDGLVDRPQVFTVDQLHALSAPQERTYRMRCVEAWSMVIPWIGVPLAHLLEAVSPKSAAKYVAFETLLDPDRMPGQKTKVLNWPYVEGLRLDEAMHPLTLLATGLYGKMLPPQDGAPIRLVVPWKYGFKGIKSIVKITLTDSLPRTSWNEFAADEYGFYANVNPQVDHPRWSQATEQRLGESGRRRTLLFNGYEEHVASLYQGFDLRVNF